MKALVYHGPGKNSWEEKPKPVLREQTDAIVKILKTTICETDLHIMNGAIPTVTDGRILGHEGVGIVVETGRSVTKFKKGDRVLILCITSCGKCKCCKKAMYSHCEKGGWILGNLIDGTEAEYVRIPHADNGMYRIPAGADEEALVMLSNILPTGFECDVLKGQVNTGDTITIIGAGPIGLAVLLTAQFFTPATIIMIDQDDNRLAVAKSFGANHTINSQNENAFEKVMMLTSKKGVDVAIETMGNAKTYALCEDIVAVGGHIANIAVHGKCASLEMENLWLRNITITSRLVDTATSPILYKTVISNKLEPKKLITHYFKLEQAIEPYDTFEHVVKEKVLKLSLTA